MPTLGLETNLQESTPTLGLETNLQESTPTLGLETNLQESTLTGITVDFPMTDLLPVIGHHRRLGTGTGTGTGTGAGAGADLHDGVLPSSSRAYIACSSKKEEEEEEEHINTCKEEEEEEEEGDSLAGPVFHPGWITSNDIYWGEEADGRVLVSPSVSNWMDPDFMPTVAGGWSQAREAVDGNGGKPGDVVPLDMPPIVSGLGGPVLPVSNWSAPSPDGTSTSTVFDFGANLGGWTRVTVSGPAGSWVRIGHAERVQGGRYRS